MDADAKKEKRGRAPEMLLRRPANLITMWALLLGVPRPPYNRRNALIIETVGRRSGQRHRIPVGFLQVGDKLVVVAEDGSRSHWVLNAQADGGRLRVHHLGKWQEAHLRLLAEDSEQYLQAMNALHATLVRRHSTRMQPVELTLAET